MTFSAEQLDALKADLNRSHVAQRTQAGRNLSYIEAWWAIAEANRIFGFDAWNRETVDLRLLGEPRMVGDKFRVGYMARVRITVNTSFENYPPVTIIREGCGFGSGIDKDPDQAHESALKEAESDAMKRALMTFGNPFGLALYDKTQAHVSDGKTTPQNDDRYDPEPPLGSNRLSSFEAKRQGLGESIKGFIDAASAKELDLWEKNFDRNTGHLPASWLPHLRERIEARRDELGGAANIADAEAELDEGFRGAIGTGGERSEVLANGAGSVAHA